MISSSSLNDILKHLSAEGQFQISTALADKKNFIIFPQEDDIHLIKAEQKFATRKGKGFCVIPVEDWVLLLKPPEIGVRVETILLPGHPLVSALNVRWDGWAHAAPVAPAPVPTEIGDVISTVEKTKE